MSKLTAVTNLDIDKGRRYCNPIEEEIKRQRLAMLTEVNNRIEYALHYLIPQPIHGNITKGKLRWRGIYLKTFATPTDMSCEKTPEGLRIYLKEIFPIVCIKESRSGKRKPLEISINFQGEVLAQYEFKRRMDAAITFGTRHRGEYPEAGVLEQMNYETKE